MGYDKLERNLIDIIKEEQAKLLVSLKKISVCTIRFLP